MANEGSPNIEMLRETEEATPLDATAPSGSIRVWKGRRPSEDRLLPPQGIEQGSAPLTPERLAEIRAIITQYPGTTYARDAAELVLAMETERARLDTLAKLRPGELFDALSDARGLRAVLDERIAEREKETGG